jgi:hypothetical protein
LTNKIKENYQMRILPNAFKGMTIAALALTTLGVTTSQASAQTDSVFISDATLTKVFGTSFPYKGTWMTTNVQYNLIYSLGGTRAVRSFVNFDFGGPQQTGTYFNGSTSANTTGSGIAIGGSGNAGPRTFTFKAFVVEGINSSHPITTNATPIVRDIY